MRLKPGNKRVLLVASAAILMFILACGSAAEPTTAPRPSNTQAPAASAGDSGIQATTAPTSPAVSSGTPVPPTPIPTAAPLPTAVPSTGTGPSGTLRIALDEIGPPRWIPMLQGAPQNSINNTTFAEAIWQKSPDGSLQGVLLETWELSEDGTVWTLNLRQGVPFHYDYGEFTAEDFIWTMENSVAEGTLEGQAENFRRQFFAEGGGMEQIDSHTVRVDTVVPAVDFTWLLTLSLGNQQGKGFFSKDYFEDVGPEKAGTQRAVGTGPWRSVSHETSGVWKFEAVTDHWRKTPNFAELHYIEIGEESTRLANFLAGKLDTAKFNLESITQLEKQCKDCRFLSSIGGELFINIHGQMYVDRDDLPTPRKAELPWISASADVNSPEWEQAKKVRLAMNLAIDRDLLAETLLGGRGGSIHVFGWLGFENRMKDLADLKYEYDPERAIQLLDEAGYPNGFEVDFALTNRPFPGTIETAEAVATMWEEVGIRANLSRQPMSSFRARFPERSWVGVNSHGSAIAPEPGPRYNPFRSTSVVNYGLEHPIMQELYQETLTTVDEEARFEVSRKIARFLFENAIIIPTVSVQQVWPVGPEIDEWEMICCVNRNPTNLEFIPHRGN